ncbi:hypothetical protein [Spirosoma flavum]|uniref:Uncharacterized protein n=1 Tax=Spirosoma flavum TaxID=2048557 RepID=A0ABW6ANU9_9BACT
MHNPKTDPNAETGVLLTLGLILISGGLMLALVVSILWPRIHALFC